MNITPLGSKLIVKRDSLPDMTPSGLLHIPQNAARNTFWCTVMSIGPEVFGIGAGDRVLADLFPYVSESGENRVMPEQLHTQFKHDGVTYDVVDLDDVLCIEVPDEK
jgi:co-chaperonin GroES (HSP10)